MTSSLASTRVNEFHLSAGVLYLRLFLEQLDLNTGGLRYPSHATTPSPSWDSSSKEHLPRVRSSIQMNIEEVLMLAILTEDVAEDTLTTNLLVIENAQGVAMEAVLLQQEVI